MNGADLIRAKHVAQIRRNGGKAAAIHGDDDGRDNDKERFILDALRPRYGAVQNRAEEKIDTVDRLATGVIGDR